MTQEDVRFAGHAIECRICAEDPRNGFLPSTGRITKLRTPGGPGLREDRGIDEGGEVTVYYDSLIAKVITWGPDRAMAIERMVRGLSEYVVEGVATNIPVCDFVMRHPAFRTGTFDTGFLQRWFHPESPAVPSDEGCDLGMALLAAWLESEKSDHPARGVPPFSPHGNADGNAGWKSARLRAMRGGSA